MRLDHATWFEVETYLERSTGIIIPTGSTEQHGPMGLIGTDAFCAADIAEGAAEIAKGKLAAVPLKGDKIYLDVSIAYLENQLLSPPAMAFLDILEKLQFSREMTPQGIGAYTAKILARRRYKPDYREGKENP